jgi:DNA-directed RNA polymerase specialized sigma24 family protein
VNESDCRSLDELLADAAWVRRLAAALVSEPADAEDVAQLTFMAAIERPPAKTGEQRQWLATVARNIARMMGRGATRRMRREALPEEDTVRRRKHWSNARSCSDTLRPCWRSSKSRTAPPFCSAISKTSLRLR